MNKMILRLIILAIAILLVIKWVPVVNDAAREYLPPPVLKLIGEQPKGIFGEGVDGAKVIIAKIM